MAKKLITKREIEKAKKVLARLDENVRDHLEVEAEIVKEYAAEHKWDMENDFQHRLSGSLAMLNTLQIITSEESSLIFRYFLEEKGRYMIEKMTGKTA